MWVFEHHIYYTVAAVVEIDRLAGIIFNDSEIFTIVKFLRVYMFVTSSSKIVKYMLYTLYVTKVSGSCLV